MAVQIRSVLIVAVGLVLGTSGCAARMAVIAHEKQAYVIKESQLGFNSDMYFCDATGGKPVCTKTTESSGGGQ
jgi:hypothetical protein